MDFEPRMLGSDPSLVVAAAAAPVIVIVVAAVWTSYSAWLRLLHLVSKRKDSSSYVMGWWGGLKDLLTL